VEVDDANETVGNKIRKAAADKIPYTLVVGDKEASSDTLAIRARGEQETKEYSRADFLNKLKEEDKSHK
jgi:threonyl-tRNA synthetase